MIIPDNKIPVDDSEDSDAEDQQSQQDIHSNGLYEKFDSSAEESDPAIEMIHQASDASEASFTLDVDKGIAPTADSKSKKD
ncbi:MAG: hypothetical protein JWR54_1844 [Mucilaginibacter sp.]|nr:hypothetical protein [Mucilaginibacter sp.]